MIGDTALHHLRSGSRWKLLGAAVVCAGIVTGCGSGGDATAVIVTGRQAYAATMHANSAHVESTASLTTGDPKVRSTTTESGSYSWSAVQGSLTMVIKSGDLDPITSHEIIDGDDTYSKTVAEGMPAVKGIPGMDGWEESVWTGDRSPAFSGGVLGLLGATSGEVDPSSVLALLQAEAGSIKDLGPETIEGTATTHYQEQLSLTKLGVPARDLGRAEKMLGPSGIPVDYWIDSSDLLRQLSVVLTESPPANVPPTTPTTVPGQASFNIQMKPPVTLSLTLRLSDYGIPVHVVPPPAAAITSHVACNTTSDGFDCG